VLAGIDAHCSDMSDVSDDLVKKREQDVSREKKQKYLEVGSELFHNSLPGNEMFDEGICKFQVLPSDVLFDKKLITRQHRCSGTGTCSGRRSRAPHDDVGMVVLANYIT